MQQVQNSQDFLIVNTDFQMSLKWGKIMLIGSNKLSKLGAKQGLKRVIERKNHHVGNLCSWEVLLKKAEHSLVNGPQWCTEVLARTSRRPGQRAPHWPKGERVSSKPPDCFTDWEQLVPLQVRGWGLPVGFPPLQLICYISCETHIL